MIPTEAPKFNLFWYVIDVILNFFGLMRNPWKRPMTPVEVDSARLIGCESLLYELKASCERENISIYTPFGDFPHGLDESIKKDAGW